MNNPSDGTAVDPERPCDAPGRRKAKLVHIEDFCHLAFAKLRHGMGFSASNRSVVIPALGHHVCMIVSIRPKEEVGGFVAVSDVARVADLKASWVLAVHPPKGETVGVPLALREIDYAVAASCLTSGPEQAGFVHEDYV